MTELRDSSISGAGRDDSPHTFHHRRTGSGQHTPLTYVGTDSTHNRRRSSAFFEVGLGGDDPIVDAKIRRNSRPRQQVRFRSKVEIHEADPAHYPEEKVDYLATRPQPPTPAFFPSLPRLMFLACIFLLGLQSWNEVGLSKAGIIPIGAKAGPVKAKTESGFASIQPKQEKRQDTTVCVRWSGQSAVVNGTLYYYGGRSSQSSGQTAGTWSQPRTFFLGKARLTMSR
jgi:hypothetical protein